MFLETIINKLNILGKERELILKNVNKIVDNKIFSNVGLVYGKVQSGKTRNLICLSAKLFDIDTNLLIFLFSDTKILLKQNHERFEEAYADLIDKDLVTIIRSDDLSILSNRDVLEYYNEKNKKIIICGLKNTSHINKIEEVIKDTPYSKNKSVIIDDEGDDITQNSNKEKFNKQGQEIKHSSVNGKLIELKKSLNCGLISVTATPQAIVLLQPFQELAPSWCEVLEISPNYTGLDSFYEVEGVLEIISDDSKKFTDRNGTPDSFIKALSYFIVSSTILYKNNSNFKSQMLIHPDKKIITHQNISRKINDNLTFYFRKTEYQINVMNIFKECFDEIKQRNIENNSVKIGEFADFTYNDFMNTIKRINVIELNTKGKLESKDIKRLIKENLPFLIFVGGDLLDRGITFPELLVTYIFRESKKMQEDTMLQRARWLGYRKDILSFSKVFLTQNLYDLYKEIVLNTNHLNEMLDFYSKKKDLDLREVDFRLRLKDIYNPTSKSKATWESNYTSWYVQTVPNFEYTSENKKIFEKYIYGLNNGEKEYMNTKFTVNYSDLKDLIYTFEFNDLDTKITVFKDFLKQLNLDEETKIDLLLMRNGDYEERSLNKDKTQINNLLQGQSAKSKDVYPGDRYLLKDRIMIQVHFVKLKENLIYNDKIKIEKNAVIPMIAVGIPYSYREDNFIKRKTLFN